MFKDINSEQKPVTRNLLNALFSEIEWKSRFPDSAQRSLMIKIIERLGKKEESPLYNRIITGVAKKTVTRCISLAYILDYGLKRTELFGIIKKRQLLKTGALFVGTDYEKSLEKGGEFFIECFNYIKDNTKDQWDKGEAKGGFVARNIGIASIVLIIADIMDFLIKNENFKPENTNSKDIAVRVKKYLKPVVDYIYNLDSEEIKELNKSYGSGGPLYVRRKFQNAIHEVYESFSSEGLEEWTEASSNKYNELSTDIGRELETMIHKITKSVLKEEFPEGNKWWLHGIPDDVQMDCHERKLKTNKSEPDENFILPIDYVKIIERNNVSSKLGNLLTPPSLEQKSKKDKLNWIVKFNSIRQKYSHPQRDNVKEEEYIFLGEAIAWVKKRYEKQCQTLI